RGITLKDGDAVVALAVGHAGQVVCAGTSQGYVKRVSVDAIPLQGRGGQGVQLLTAAEKAGAVVGLVTASSDSEARFVTGSGATVEVDEAEVPVVARATRAVQLSAWPGGLTAVALVATPTE
ncbi:DNA gyrase C-terminal beta-propeller domain-containing protein, partial [Gemmatimonas sp.]|uniref:DNA gyrase C-terminal beta-propeller domain-containing protein n=1 Tax=Gemmatimonas sp. TaxID=1962908 RepID=UPI0037BEAC56